jgi:hypothetical protein
MSASRHPLTRLALALLPLTSTALAPAGTVTWTGLQGGSWATAANWSGSALPGALDDVQLGSFDTQVEGEHVIASLTGAGVLRLNNSGSRLTVNGAADLGALNLGLGTLIGNAGTRVGGSLRWSAGALTGTGSTEVVGQTVFASSLFNTRTLGGGHTLTLAGGVQMADSFGLHIVGGSNLVNTGTWQDQASTHVSLGSLDAVSGPANRFDNRGSYVKSGGATTTIARGVAFDNSGSVAVNAGTLSLLGGGNGSAGSFSVGAGAVLDFNHMGQDYALGRNLTNAGVIKVSAGDVNAAAGLAVGGAVEVSSGALNLGAASSFATLSLTREFALLSGSTAGTIHINHLNWAGGALSGGTFAVSGSMALSSDDFHSLRGTLTLGNSASTQVTGTAARLTGNQAVIQNNGAWEDRATVSHDFEGAGTFRNNGTFRKLGTGTTSLDWAFNNSGAAIIGTGTLRLMGGSNSANGFIALAEGSTLEMGGTTPHALGRNLSSAGTLLMQGTTVNAAAGLDLGGQTRLNGGSLTLGANSRMNALTLQGGATLSAAGTLSVTGPMVWEDGHLAGSGRTRVLDTLTLSGNTTRTVAAGHTLELLGTTALNAGTLQVLSPFNQVGSFILANGATLQGGNTSFANAGTLSGTGTVRALDSFTNTGLITPGGTGQTGTLQVLGNFVNSGVVQMDLGRTAADQLSVSGTAALGGTLQLAVLPGQRLQRGSQFNLLAWDSRAAGSEFGTLDFSQATGYRFATAYDTNSLTLTVVAVPFVWTGPVAGGVWDAAGNWNDGSTGLPQAGDTVLLGDADTRIRSVMSVGDITGTGSLNVEAGGRLVMDGTGSVGGLQLRSGSQLTNAGRLVATGASSWVGAALRGAGVTRIEGLFTIAGNFFDATPTLINGHTLELAGTTTYAGQRGLSVGDGATLVNQGTWVDQSPNDVTFGNFNGGSGRFVNQGTFTKASSTRTLIGEGTGMAFENTGTLNVDAGYLRLSSSRVSSTGTVHIAAGAELSLVSANATLGGQVVNQGTLGLDGGPLAVAGDLVLQGSGLTRLKSTIGNTGLLTIEGSVDWIDGNLTGAGTTRLLGDVSFATGARNLRNGQTLEILGTVTQTGTGSLNTGGGARVLNLGSWVDAANGNVGLGNFGGGASSRFDNVGSFTKTSAFVTEIGNGLNLNNTGLLDVQAGTLRLSDNATLAASGQVRAAAGATLDLGANQVLLAGTLQNAGTLLVSGTLAVTDSAAVLGAGQTLLRGAVQNSGQLRLAGSTEWGPAVLRGSGTTRIEGPLTITGASGRGLIGHTLELAGNTVQTGTGSINTGSAARLVNLGTWTEAATGPASIGNFSGGAASRFDNVGRFVKTSAFVTDVGNGVVLNNTGRIDVQAGTLRLSQAFNNQGVIDIAAGAELASTVTAFANAGTLGGDGTVRTVGSFFSLSNTGTLAAGGLNDAGTLSLIGGLTQEAGGIFLVDLGGTAAGSFDLLTVSGSASLAGTLAVNLLAGAHFNVGDSFTVMTWGQRLGDSQFASLDLSHAAGYTFATEYGANSLTLRVMTAAPVPEPGSWALMAVGLAGLGLWTRRRQATAGRA